MYKQETIFYPDTFQIHITKEYNNNILVEEKHYTLNNILYYWNDYLSNTMIKKFFFKSETLDTIFSDYFYMLTNIDNEAKIKLHSVRKDNIHIPLVTHIDGTFILTQNTCTHLCTLNNDEAVDFIRNYIKIQILEE
jgi:hypothetical protein